MLFNSFAYALFLPIVYVLYWALQDRPLRAQNALLLAANYVFYGWWDYRFLLLLFANCIVDYLTALWLERETSPRGRRFVLLVSLVANLGVLGFFKYYGFFLTSFVDLLQRFGLRPNVHVLRVILPVGVSFYTFQSLSYTIDVYRRRLRPTRDLLAFLTFHSFFPQLVAGPIERAADLLPQVLRRRTFDVEAAKDGVRQMLWGLFKKVVIADRLGAHVDHVFRSYASLGGLDLLAGTFFFAIQIYCDFSGYTDIAIGTARLFGFRLTRNFAYPYFSRNMAEFWHRWHITLSTWFRDYVYIPLGGNRGTKWFAVRNVILTFVISGLWHGANWTFVAWGLLNGLYYAPVMLSGEQHRYTEIVAAGRLLPTVRDALRIAATFALTLLAWVFFRADSLPTALRFLGTAFSRPYAVEPLREYARALVAAAAVMTVEWLQRTRPHGLAVENLPRPARWLAYYAVTVVIFFFGDTGNVPFIYFQF
jgi:D-alanyl-lipoteichoic acid acyltransferase DltB (MBOAT superfamily)